MRKREAILQRRVHTQMWLGPNYSANTQAKGSLRLPSLTGESSMAIRPSVSCGVPPLSRRYVRHSYASYYAQLGDWTNEIAVLTIINKCGLEKKETHCGQILSGRWLPSIRPPHCERAPAILVGWTRRRRCGYIRSAYDHACQVGARPLQFSNSKNR